MNNHFKYTAVLFCFCLFLVCSVEKSSAQVQLGGTDAIDYARPMDYEIGGIEVTGAQNLDEGAIINISGLTVGDKITVPGDRITRAIEHLWKQGLFSDIKISASKVLPNPSPAEPNLIFLIISLQEKPRLSRFSFKGVTKSEADDIREKVNLVKGKSVTENLKKNTNNTIVKFFREKGFLNVAVKIKEQRDSSIANSVMLTITVEKNKKIKINHIYFHGNTQISSNKLKHALKDTKEKSHVDIVRDVYQHFRADSIKTLKPGQIIAGLTSPKKFYDYVSPRLRLAIFSTSKFIDDTYQGEKQMVVARYAEAGYRDAKIAFDTVTRHDAGTIDIDITVNEGKKYYFRNLAWVGNTKHTNEELDNILNIKKGDVFNQGLLDSRLMMNPEGKDVSSLYLDDGYLFFSVNPVEVNVENDSIDLEMRIYEGKQAIINKVFVSGNTKTNDRVIMREIRTRPGELFSRNDITRSERELAQLGYFDPEKLNVNPKPNPAEGTVDIEYIVEEKPSDQVELSGGWGAGQLVGTLGVTFNNFSGRNLFKKGAWAPLPSGDGQKLALRGQTNGKYFQSYNTSFTEPWLGGKKSNSLSVSAFHSVNSNGISKTDATQQRQAVAISGGSVGFGWRLKFPDDYFSRFVDFTYQYYDLDHYSNFIFNNGYANSFSASLSFSRNSIDQPTFPKAGSNLSFTAQLTPPYSLLLFAGKDYSTMTDQQKYKFVEYHKWKFVASWFQRLTNNKNCFVLNTRMKFGFLGHYNNQIGDSPFERFYLGGDGLSGFQLDGREIIALRGYEDSYLTPRGLTSAGTSSYIGGTAYDKYTMEIRYPISLNPQATIYVLGFAEGGNDVLYWKDFNPLVIKRSAGLGVRIFLPMFGQLGLDYGWGFDQGTRENPNIPTKGRFSFSIGQSIE